MNVTNKRGESEGVTEREREREESDEQLDEQLLLPLLTKEENTQRKSQEGNKRASEDWKVNGKKRLFCTTRKKKQVMKAERRE